MAFDLKVLVDFVRKLLLVIFEKFDVTKEFEALNVDITGILEGKDETED